jgi:hypothetical protein
MKKLLFFGSLLFIAVMFVRFLVARAPTYRYQGTQAQALTNNTEYPSATRTPQSTSTLIPSATIDYQQTAIVAQSTADEARRINSMATAEYVRLINEQLAMTQVVEQQNFMIQSWTATAALTTIPLTATQQAVNNTQIPAQQQIISAQLTATKNAPTQIVAMENAKNYAKYAEANQVAGVVGKFSVGGFVIGILIFIFRIPVAKKVEPMQSQPEAQLETVVWLKNTKDNGAQSIRNVIPCTPEQLTDLATKITQGETTFGINQWEQVCKTFKSDRDIIHAVRGWLQLNKFAYANGKGELAPSDEGLDFLCGWLESNRLPTEYEFKETPSPEMPSPSNHDENMEKSPITMGNHNHDNGGGGAYPTLAVGNSK